MPVYFTQQWIKYVYVRIHTYVQMDVPSAVFNILLETSTQVCMYRNKDVKYFIK